MNKIIPLTLGCLALITIFVTAGSVPANAYNDRITNATGSTRQTSMGCAPLPSTPLATTAEGNFRISTFLSDDELTKFKYESFIFELAPGQSDTISHRHDCDVFVTVLEGTALIGQEFKKPDTVKTGEIFHEKRNVIHSVSINPSQRQQMKALVVFIRKDGRAGYTPLYPKKQ